MSPLLESLLKKIEELSDEERLKLMEQMAAQRKSGQTEPKRKHKISEFRGMVQYPFFGEDAQEWVTRNRHESDELSPEGMLKTEK